jgi:hypothetical protein
MNNKSKYTCDEGKLGFEFKVPSGPELLDIV